jgi:hypothetical protein
VTLYVTSEKVIARDTVLDGGGMVTLSGGGTTRILAIRSTFDRPGPRLTLQAITLRDGRGSGAALAGGGGAVYHLGGSVTAIDVRFIDNAAVTSGPDVAGGAIFGIGLGETVIVRSVFRGNRAASGGAVGSLHTALTIVDSAFESNEATGRGAGGATNEGGNGGAVSMDGEDRTLVVCGSTFRDNRAGAIGGALFRTSYAGEPTVVDRSLFDGNATADVPEGEGPSLAGGLYLQGTSATITATTVSRNVANAAGGLWIGSHGAAPGRADLENVTIHGNAARERSDFTKTGLAGGVFLGGAVSGTFRNCTIADNRAQFGAGIVGVSRIALVNTIVSNVAANRWVSGNCSDSGGGPATGTGNLQFLATPAGGQDDPCVAGIAFGDPLLGPLGDHGGPTPTRVPAAGSPAVALGASCPPADQRGVARPAACTAGAVEVP